MRPGDLLFVHDDLPFSRLIRAAQRLRYPETAARWNHVAICVQDGWLVEAEPGGVHEVLARKYDGMDTQVIALALKDEDRAQVLAFARLQAAEHRRYGIVSILSIGMRLLGGLISFSVPGTYTCSGLVGEALKQGGVPLGNEELCPAGLFMAIKSGE